MFVSPRTASWASDADTANIVEQVRVEGSSFYWGMRVLPPRRRLAVFAVYAFCRAVDDVADGVQAQHVKLARLEDWRMAIEDLYAGQPRDPITRVLADHCQTFDLPRAEFHNIIAGMETDARGGLLGPTYAEFETYCRRVAGAVGVLSMQIFAHGDRAATDVCRREVAEHLGQALQITNVLRDRLEDAAEGRLYLPRELLDTTGIKTREPRAVVQHPACSEVCAALSRQARTDFQHVRSVLKQLKPSTSRPCWIMMGFYERLLVRLEEQSFPVESRVRLSGLEKALLTLRHGLVSPLT